MAAYRITTLVVAILFCFLAAGARTKPYSKSGQDGISTSTLVAEDGICISMVESQGYICEDHKVTTKDAYILGMQRIPAGRSGKKPNNPPVLLQHGLIVDGGTWMMGSPDEALAFILADNGYDVWVGNVRGTTSSRGHTSLNPTDPEYWEWSWDELVAYDLHAQVKYVQDHTGQKLHYVGHSLGTLMAFAAFSKKEVLNMLRSAALLSPIAYLNQIPSPLAQSGAGIILGEALYWLGLREFVPRGDAADKLLAEICKDPTINCNNLMDIFTGPNCCLNSSTTSNFLAHEPQPTSTKNIIHVAQMVKFGTIQMYDYGNIVQNMQHYGQATPPVYDMSSIPNDFPLFLSYGGEDYLSDVNDVHKLLGQLENHDRDKLVVQYKADYAHADFLFGINAKQEVYDPLMAFFKQH